MRVILFRHGIALDREDPRCPPDPARPLTGRGRKRTQAAVRGLARLEARPDRILSSPYVRALQTAEVAADALGHGGAIQTEDALRPVQDPQPLIARLSEMDAETVLCVGHNPNLNELLAALTGRTGSFTWLRKAGAACVTLDGGTGTLEWLLEPKALRRLGEAG
jgi:phosphohistidine phosphatase